MTNGLGGHVMLVFSSIVVFYGMAMPLKTPRVVPPRVHNNVIDFYRE